MVCGRIETEKKSKKKKNKKVDQRSVRDPTLGSCGQNYHPWLTQ